MGNVPGPEFRHVGGGEGFGIIPMMASRTGWTWMDHLRVVTAWLLVAVSLGTLVGCSSNNYLTLRKVPRNPLAGPLQLFSSSGPQPSARTVSLLRRYDLADRQEQNPSLVLASLGKEISLEPSPEKIYSFAELAYVEGKSAEGANDLRRALDCYGAAVSHAYLFLFDPRLDPMRNPYDPQFRLACDIYNGSLEAALRIWKSKQRLKPGMVEHMTVAGKEIELSIEVRGAWPADDIEDLDFVSEYKVSGLTNLHHTYGLGVPLVGVRRPNPKKAALDRYYPKLLAFPVTAFLRVERLTGTWQPTRQASASSDESSVKPPPLRCILELHDPLNSSDLTIADRRIPLETDLSTPLAYMLELPSLRSKKIVKLGFTDPTEAEATKGIYMLEPYQAHKIPVIMAHGLLSSPMTWMEQFNDLRAMPEVRERYQFWFYLYPTGKPFWASATSFRQDLNDLLQVIDPTGSNPAMQRMVLVGHSMGGLVSMLQTLDSEDHLWRMVSDKPFEQLKADPEVKQRLASMLFFRPNPNVAHVITIGTPHHGSDFANDTTRWLSHKLVDMPNKLVQTRQQLLTDNPDVVKNTELFTITTSIDSLAPENPIFRAMERMPRAAHVKYHNIIGLAPTSGIFGKFSKGSDGVVTFDSARIEDVDSELVIEADHTHVHRHPRAILEVRRILLEHAVEYQAQQESTGAGNVLR